MTRDLSDPTPPTEPWVLRLYMAGHTPKSIAARRNLENFCESHLEHRYQIEVIDLLQDPTMARHDEILAIGPVRKILGDLSNPERVRTGLDLEPKA